MLRRTAIAAIGAVLLVGSGLSLVTAGASAPHDRAPAPLIKIAKFRHDFSPNKDGYHDHLGIPVVLSRSAVLKVRVVGLDSKLVLVHPDKAICLSGHCRLARGTHTVRWTDILRLMGPYRPGPGQRFSLTFHASTPGGKRTASARTVVTLRNPVQVGAGRDGNGQSFSPNGDGRHDRLRIGYDLEQSAGVRAVVRAVSGPTGQGKVVAQVRLGRRSAGHHTWTWSPAQKGSARPADGSYTATIVAVPPAHRPGAGRARVAVVVDTVGPDVTSTSTRTTVYPATTLFTDEVRFEFGPGVHSLTASVRRPDGSLVRTLKPGTISCYDPASDDPSGVASCPLRRWDGRSEAGGALPAGSYVLRAVGYDAVGNQTVATTPLTVSGAPLVEHTTTTTLPAAKWPGGFDSCSHSRVPAGCELNYNPPVASDRFADGLSFRAGSRTSEISYAVEGETGHERFRVTATGGPTTNGPDIAWLNGTLMQGNGTFTTDWIPVTFTPDQLKARGTWTTWTTSGNSYDVASYTVEQTYFAPAS